jgi:ring-1,2-phenylacetyl-CoA epoxidase subunit PaaB
VKVYEVFLKKDGKDSFVHAGSLEAPDDEMALLLGRESYVRRGEGDHMWLVAREHLVQADEAFLGPNAHKPHRLNDGSRIAAHRRAARAGAGTGIATGDDA